MIQELYAKAKPWIGQATTGLGIGGGLAAIAGVASGAITWKQAIPALAASAYWMAHPEQAKAKPFTADDAQRLGQSVAEALQKDGV